MLDILCEHCRNIMILDELSTFESYKEDGRTKLNEDGTLAEESIPEYLIFKCLKCDATCNLTYKEWFDQVKQKIARDVLYSTRQELFKKHINPHIIDPDNGLEFCGQCPGVDNEGNCYVDIIKQCPMRDL